MVLVHEMGHFLVAKACGVRVEAFAFGFGPRLFGFKYGDTDYKVCALPLGGFVKMTGENPGEDAQEDDPGAFMAHPRWQRMLIGLAGPAANFLLAFALMFFYYAFINEVPKYEVHTTTVEWVIQGSAAQQAGIQPGDVIARFDGVENPEWIQVAMRSALNQNQNVALAVQRGGQVLPLTLHVPAAARNEDFDLTDVGLIQQVLLGPIAVREVSPGSPAAQAGLKSGDAIAAVDGHPFHYVESLLYYLKAGQGSPVTLSIIRAGAPIAPIVAHPAILDSAKTPFPYKLGFNTEFPITRDPQSLPKAWKRSAAFSVDNSTLIIEVLGRIFTHKVAVSQLSGPVGIARMAGQAAEMNGWLPKFGLAAAISINLGILNLLPFPVLDGGLILFLLIESIIRRDISMAVKERIYQAAFVLIIAFFAFVIFNDVTKLPIFNHPKP